MKRDFEYKGFEFTVELTTKPEPVWGQIMVNELSLIKVNHKDIDPIRTVVLGKDEHIFNKVKALLDVYLSKITPEANKQIEDFQKLCYKLY
jgi:hypothetical protein